MSEEEIPACPGPLPQVTSPRLCAPAGSCDVHTHVFGPATRYPYSPSRGYTPPDARIEKLADMHRTLGIDRVVLTQPSVYGTDNRAILDALSDYPGEARAVAATTAEITDGELEYLHRRGVRGLRMNLADKGGMPFPDLEAVRKFSHRLKSLGWHIEFLLHADDFDDISAALSGFAVDVVIGHLGYLRPPLDPSSRAVAGLLQALASGNLWVKLTGTYRVTASDAPPYQDVTPLARVLIGAAPDRMLWGSDWPHPFHYRQMPPDDYLLDQMLDWTGETGLHHKILVDNPARLYGF